MKSSIYSNNNLAIYVHWPFCLKKCPYCDFNSHVRDEINHELWKKAYLKEIEIFSDFIKNKNITSVFFGGGTPSLMQPNTVESIINKISKFSSLDKNIEITLEANPTSIEARKFTDFKNAGVNRVSIGVQSFNDKDLLFLGREHNSLQAKTSIELANKIFDNFTFDLIYALPNQTIQEWQTELEKALEYAKYHISLYQLTIEKGTRFYSMYNKGEFVLPNENLSVKMYNATRKITKKFGFLDYEISNYAKKKYESKHNLTYWKYKEYLGLGPGAHSRINNRAMKMIYSPEKWLEKIEKKQPALMENSPLSIKEQMKEFVIMNLRLSDGILLDNMQNLFNYNLYDFIDFNKIILLKESKMLEKSDSRIKLTNKGKLILNRIIEYIIQN